MAIGLANRCVPDDELESATLDFAREMIRNSWFSLQTEKKLFNGGLALGLREALHYERAHSPGAGPDMAERLKAFGRKS